MMSNQSGGENSGKASREGAVRSADFEVVTAAPGLGVWGSYPQMQTLHVSFHMSPSIIAAPVSGMDGGGDLSGHGSFPASAWCGWESAQHFARCRFFEGDFYSVQGN